MESQAQLSQQHRSQTQSLQNFNIPKRRGAWAQPRCLSNRICMESTTAEEAQVPTGGDQRHWRLKTKTTETESRSPLATVYACTASWWSVPGKIWMPTNQIRDMPLRAHVFRELRARAPQASRSI